MKKIIFFTSYWMNLMHGYSHTHMYMNKKISEESIEEVMWNNFDTNNCYSGHTDGGSK